MQEQLAYLLLGSNIGDRRANLLNATELLVLNGIKLLRQSRIYESAAWGKTKQAHFYNQCLKIRTSLTPLELLDVCQAVEKKIGRVKREKWMEREIDIDILFFDNHQLNSARLTLPHPYIIRRRFVLVPLNELAPSLVHPVFQLPIDTLTNLCTDDLECFPI